MRSAPRRSFSATRRLIFENMIVVSGTSSTPCKNVTSRYDDVSDVSVPSGRPDASILSIM